MTTAGPKWLTGPKIEKRLYRFEDPISILIEQYEIAIYYIQRGWPVSKYHLLTPIQRNGAGCDPVCAQYDTCDECPLDAKVCGMIVDATSRPIDDIERYKDIVRELKKLNGTKQRYGPRPPKVEGPKRNATKRK